MEQQLKRYTILKSKVILIQRTFRANLMMKVDITAYRELRSSAILIQRYYRSYLETKKVRREFLVERRAVVVVQRYVRGFLVRRKHAHLFTPEAREQRRVLQIQNAAATKIQAVWKGYKSRSTENSECRKIRQRFQIANAVAAPEKTLAWKCKVALQTFANVNATLFHIINALEDMDFAIRRCKALCLEMSSLLPDQLYIMLSATSRSLPEMKACIYSVNILISFCKFPPTKQCSFVPQYIDNLVTVMLHWCDKESQLFPTLCTLFWLFAHTAPWKRFILSLPNIEQRLRKIHGLVSRKQAMVKRSVVKGGVSHFASFKNLPLPSLNPDWGLDYKNKPNVFTNSTHALSALASILNM
ncbi:hypothetical protein JTB14_031213 [Gonioctena quinquepunctata]|nr:hypothetical protein JTB14_031213 [Gonioctena quinquepunctata]